MKACLGLLIASVLSLCLGVVAQESQTTKGLARSQVVPNMISYSGILKDANGKNIYRATGVTFLLYRDQEGGAPVWLETQTITPGPNGRYVVQLGAASVHGLPSDLFRAGEARWLAVQIAGEAEQTRVLLVAVPYAMKAADAETLGGLPPSAFALVAPVAESVSPSSTSPATGSSVPPPATSNVTTTGGTVNTIPLFTTATNI